MRGMLVSAVYDSELDRVVLKFYDPAKQRLVLWAQREYTPYCYTTLQHIAQAEATPGVIKTQNTMIKDVLTDTPRPMAKILCKNHHTMESLEVPTWGADIKTAQNFLYDNDLHMGSWYDVSTEGIEPIVQESESMKQLLHDSHIKEWANLLDQQVPEMNRIAIDIEVMASNTFERPDTARQPITAIGYWSGKEHDCLLLDNYTTEKEMLEHFFTILERYPFVITFNGDEYDLPYLHNRAQKLGVKHIPLQKLKHGATTQRSVHIDLFPVFKNRSLRLYTFKNKYNDLKLDTIARALLNESKIEHSGFHTMTKEELYKYCLNDARITYRLSSSIMDILVMLSRISNMGIDEMSRTSLSHWAKSMILTHMKKNNMLMPRREELDARTVGATEAAIIKDKKYKGALVMQPIPGIHFGVKVVDFASLYPSIVKNFNLSFETVRCPHEECRTNTHGNHWVCKRNRGIMSTIVGSLMVLRTKHYKKLAKTSPKYGTIEQTLKVILNGSYGIIGFDKFPFYYLPTAEMVTAIGRNIISSTINRAGEMDMNVIYSDTDSVMIRNPVPEKVEELIKYATDTFDISLEMEKEYRYVIMSTRKKNYLGINKDGKIDIKGLTGKKSNTPMFIKNTFNNITNTLGGVEKEEQFGKAKSVIGEHINNVAKLLIDRNIPLEELAISTMLTRDPSEYSSTPQHLKAAALLDREFEAGEYIRYIKTNDKYGVKPLELVDKSDVNVAKYRELLRAAVVQLIEPLDMDFDECTGLGRRTTIDEYFG